MHIADAMSEFISRGLDLLDAKSGLVHGSQQVFLTRDGGLTWRYISDSTSSLNMDDCSFSSENTVTCVGGEQVDRTVDGGETWERRIVPGGVDLSGVSFVTDDVGWVVGSRGEIFHTTDGGQTWVPQSAGTFSDLTDVEFVDERAGAAVGETRDWSCWGCKLYRVFYTGDGGATWSWHRVPWDVYDIAWAGSTLAVATGEGIYLSEDGGETWRMAFDASFGVRSAAILNSTTAVALDRWGGIHRTSDGGDTWVTDFESFTRENLSDVWFTDRNTGIVVGDNGTILRTTDAGQTWELPYGGTESDLRAVAFGGPDLGVAIGDSVIILTTDGGITWTGATVPIDIPEDYWGFRDVTFVDGAVVVVVGHHSILRSEDGGASWSEQYRAPAGEILLAVSFSDSMTGWVVGADIVLQTADGGRTWASSEEEPPWCFERKYCVDEDTGFALYGSYFYGWTNILRTDDGGETWQFQIGVSGGLSGLHAIDRDVVTVVGDGGKILRMETGGIATNREAGPLRPEVPGAVSLDQNYPNPFNPDRVGTTISYTLPRFSDATLTVYDMLGRRVSVLASGTQPAGSYQVSFDATGLPSGTYFYRLEAGDYVVAKRMVVVR